MIRVCPLPLPWIAVHQRMSEFARVNRLPGPPHPIILGGWNFTNDMEKHERWKDTCVWATTHECVHLLDLTDNDFYCVQNLTAYKIGPMGGPMLREWDFENKQIPSDELIEESLIALSRDWLAIAGDALATITKPLRFTGDKGRRLLVEHGDGLPPWGHWDSLLARYPMAFHTRPSPSVTAETGTRRLLCKRIV